MRFGVAITFRAIVLAILNVCCSVAIADEKIHVVKSKETLRVIGRRYGVSESEIARRNHLKNPNLLQIGQRLFIPDRAPGGYTKYVVRKGDSLALITRKTGISQAVLLRHNSLSDPDRIQPGQELKIPLAAGKRTSPGPELPATLRAQLDRVRCSKRWKNVVVHHSGSDVDTIRGMNAYHLARGMENGLAYHFVIGNGRKGTGLSDGGIYVGNRWKRQLDGGHVASVSLNRKSIGICLVGDFNRRSPSAKQMQSLAALVDYLVDHCRIRKSRVKTHREINPRPTQCPGKRFPSKSFLAKIGG